MSRLILHIGLHKTATTTIQDTFFQNRALLAEHDLIYPEIGRARGHHALVTQWIPLPPAYAPSGPPRDIWRRLAQDYAETDKTVFLSSEEFSRAMPRQVDLGELRELTAGFDEIKVVCVLRSQRAFLQSIYQEISRGRPSPDAPDFIKRAVQSARADGLWLNYDQLLTHLETAFRPDELHFLSFEAATASPGGIIGEMLRVTGVPLDVDMLTPFGTGKSNASGDPLATLVAGMIARPRVADRSLFALVEQTLKVEFGETMKGMIYNIPEAARMLERFEPSNAKFEKRRAALQPGLMIARPSPELQPGEIGRHQLTRTVWERLACAVYAEYGKR